MSLSLPHSSSIAASLHQPPRPQETALLAQQYHLGHVIERGPLSVINHAIHRTSQKSYAIKTVDLQKYEQSTGLDRQVVEEEISMCATLKHPFICELKDVISGDTLAHLVFEHLDGADLCFEIVKRTMNGFVYSEAVISHYMKQLLQALEYLHSNFIVHRDIRPHNLVLASKDNSAPLKVTGFGVALKLSEGNGRLAGGLVGVPHFMAPEIVGKREYGTKADVWSAGVLLYLLLSGRLPFSGSNAQIYESIEKGQYSVSGGIWSFISNSAKDLLIRLLTVDEEQRFSATEALQHDWLRDKDVYAPRRHLQETVDNIKRYNSRRKLKSTILSAVNTDKWSKFPIISGRDGTISASSSTFFQGDLPGGDTCHPDGCTRATQPTATDLIGAHKILESLDRIAVLTDAPVLPQLAQGHLMEDSSFKRLLLVCEFYFHE
ncbi:unnamed protein product, partial [Mesorhabditis belari]|uniref:Protein kinase domain-containing protein n=1 Tax=Mesorhabditis belari TaxID=2138241 RepID=A0AAF3FP43_9BILA